MFTLLPLVLTGSDHHKNQCNAVLKISEVTKENMRGILVFVLNQRTGVPMAVRAFDTYASKEEGGAMIKFIEELQDGRIVCMAIKVM